MKEANLNSLPIFRQTQNIYELSIVSWTPEVKTNDLKNSGNVRSRRLEGNETPTILLKTAIRLILMGTYV
mgnify:CR=1 FL=1